MSRKEEVKTLSPGKPKRAKRGVGTIIGAAFIIMILLSGFAFYALILNNIDNYNKSASEANASEWNRNREQLTISSIQITSENKLSLTAKNTGSVSSRLLWLGLFNQTATPEWQRFANLSKQIEPAGNTSILPADLPADFIVTQGRKYVIQLVTEAGNVFDSKFYPASEVNCALSLTVASPTTYAGNNVTVMLTVTLNDTEVDIVQSITTSISVSPTGLVGLVGNSPLTVTGLAKGGSAFFWWVYNTISTGTVTFNATYSSAPVGSYALTNVNVLAAPSQGGGNGSTVVVSGVNGTGEYNPSQMTPLGGTQYVSGSVASLSANDSNYAIFSSYYTGSGTDSNHFVDNDASNVDGSPNKGTHSNFPAQQVGPDSIYDTLTEASSTATNTYNPSSYGLLGSTQLVSGTVTDLQTNNGAYMTFRSYQSASTAQLLYAHSENTTIGTSPYYLQRLISADGIATTLSASMGTTGRQLWGKFVYPLSGVTSIPASTWTMNYRAWRDTGSSTGFDAASNAASRDAASLSWSHTTGSGANRLLVVGVSIRVTTVSVSSITYGAQSLTFIRADTNTGNIRSELWYLIAPASGTAAITVTLSGGVSNVISGASTYTGVIQTSPLDAQAGGSGSNSTPYQSITVNSANCWLIGNLGICGSNTEVSEGVGQAMRWDNVIVTGAQNDRCRGHGSDKGPVSAGSQSMNWSLSSSADWAVSVAAFKTAAPSGSADVNILIRQSDGTVRTTIATGAASSPALSSTAATLQGTYSWAIYTVVSQTDYLEIDYYVNVTSAGSDTNAYLRIDDNTLSTTDQTRAANVMLPSEYTVEVEFFGTSDTQTWTQLIWTIDSSFTASGVTATFQLYNYTAVAYSTSGDGYMTDTIGTTDLTKTQTITMNPTQFKDASGNWQLKVKGVKTTTSQFNWQGDLVAYTPSVINYELDLEVQWTSVDFSQTNEWLYIYCGTMATETLRVDVWDGSSWHTIITPLSSGWNNVSVSSYLTSSNFTIRFKDASNDTTQDSWNIDVALLHLWTTTDQYTAQVEFTGSSNLQNWTTVLWQIQSCWNVSQVSVSIQLYNFTLGNYAPSGSGYLSYTSSATPNTNELQPKNETLSANDFKNATTGYWKIKVTGVKSVQFLMKIDWIDMQTTFSATGDTIPFNTWQYYSINATTTTGNPIPYAYVAIYANGTSITFKNATDGTNMTNPIWVYLDVSGTYLLKVNSASATSETFVLYAVVGSVVGQKTVTQEP